jgi:hypothetical protein
MECAQDDSNVHKKSRQVESPPVFPQEGQLAPLEEALGAIPAEDWGRTWSASRTIMLRNTSKKVKELLEKMSLPTVVRLRWSVWDDFRPDFRQPGMRLQLECDRWEKRRLVTMQLRFRKPGEGPWVPAEGLTDLLTGDPLSEGGDKRIYKTAALFHTGGVVAARIDCPYDGNNDAVMNVDDKYLFTWELIRKYLKELRLQPTNYSRFVNAMEEKWEGSNDMCDTLRKMFPVVLQSSTSSTDPLKQFTTKFSHAVHGYITLLNIDWPDLFRCRCIFEDDSKGTIVYDNACNLVIFIQNREPSFFKNYSIQCDNFHHEHGGSGKGHRNCGPGTNMIYAGLHTPGTYSGNLIEQKNSRVRTLEALVSSECQPRMMNTARYWHANTERG